MDSPGQIATEEGIILILAPLGRDAEGAKMLLDKADIACRVCPTLNTLIETIDEKTGAILVAEESFHSGPLPEFIDTLQKQPVWSDIPVVVLTLHSGGRIFSRSSSIQLAEMLSNVMFLERPLHGLTLVSAVRSALKARRRQYQSRDYLQERERVAEELKQKEQRLAESNRELEQFATFASHDLQAPLRKVQMFTDMVINTDGEKLSEESQDYLARAIKATSRMQMLISDLLNLSRVSQKGEPFKKIKLQPILQSAMDDLLEYQREVEGVINIDPTDIEFFGDGDQLQRAFRNLIQNGLKFHRRGTSPVIKVCTEKLDGRFRLTISDNGIGISQDYAERIFETFQRLHGQNDYPGTGVGLSIVRKIIERHGGHIQLESQAGEGSRFIVELPVLQKTAIERETAKTV